MRDDEFTSLMDILAAQTRTFCIMRPEIDKAIETCERAEAVGPIFDPSEFRRGGQRLYRNRVFLMAVRSFLDVVETLASCDSATAPT